MHTAMGSEVLTSSPGTAKTGADTTKGNNPMQVSNARAFRARFMAVQMTVWVVQYFASIVCSGPAAQFLILFLISFAVSFAFNHPSLLQWVIGRVGGPDAVIHYMMVDVNDRRFEARGDSGCNFGNIICLHHVKKLRLKVKPGKRLIRSATEGPPVESIGTVVLPIRLYKDGIRENVPHKTIFWVVSQYQNYLTLGHGFLDDHNDLYEDPPKSRFLVRPMTFAELFEGLSLWTSTMGSGPWTGDYLPMKFESALTQELMLKALLDTGAAVNAISVSAALKYVQHIRGVIERTTLLKTFNRRRCWVHLEVEMEFFVGEKRITETFHVVPGLVEDIILGRKFIRREEFRDLRPHLVRETMQQSGAGLAAVANKANIVEIFWQKITGQYKDPKNKGMSISRKLVVANRIR